MFGGGNWWQKTNYFANLNAEKGLGEMGVILPPPPYTLPQTRKQKKIWKSRLIFTKILGLCGLKIKGLRINFRGPVLKKVTVA